MRHLKLFEEHNLKYINILLDTTASVVGYIKPAIWLTDFGEYDKINLIQFTNKVEKYEVIDDANEIIQKKFSQGWNADINKAIDFLFRKGLENYKTFIVTDEFDRLSDFSKLYDYELVKVDEDVFDYDYSIPKEIKREERKSINKYNL